MRFHLHLAALVLLPTSGFAGQEPTLASGQVRLSAREGQGRWLALEAGPHGPTRTIPRPLNLEVDGEAIAGGYDRASLADDVLVCEGSLRSRHGTRFIFHDRYRATTPGAFELAREVEVAEPRPDDTAFNTGFRLELGPGDAFQAHEYFVPAVWYRTNFAPRVAGWLAADPADQVFLFREDRLPLPLVAARDRGQGTTTSLIHVGAEPTTFPGDQGGLVVDARLRFGSLGVRRDGGLALAFLFPGSEGERSRVPGTSGQGWARRSHPVRAGIEHRYRLTFALTTSASYPAAVEQTWKQAFDLYRPAIRPVDLRAVYDGLLATLDHYAVGRAEGYDAPGFPFSVLLPSGKVRAYNYQMGFIGRQLPNAAYLLREGWARGRTDWVAKGEAIADFWARACPQPDGLPHTWYDPSPASGRTGGWRSKDNLHGGTALRVAATGMEGLLAAWEHARQARQDRPAWLAAARAFGDWLVANQNEDGSYFLAYGAPDSTGRRAPTETSKAATTNQIRFLVALHRATGDDRYLRAAVRAGDYCLGRVHADYCYAGSVIDNPVTLDRESGQEALAAFLALRDATKEPRWLEAATQAARYTETWMIAYEIPAVPDGPAGFPADRSVVGQTLIATGQSAADLGLAFSAGDYYRLYLFTGDAHFLHVARLLLHNTKQALNWDGSLYPGLPRGLQLEAFSVSMPRRRGVMECLSWNYAAHLDPLVRLNDRFGSFDLEEIERLPRAKRQALNE